MKTNLRNIGRERCLQNEVTVQEIDLLVQNLPPAHDAIGAYTSCLAAELARLATVRILTNRELEVVPIPGVVIQSCFHASGSARFTGIVEQLRVSTADAVVLQYNPFSWGRRGWAPDLVRSLRGFKLSRPGVVLGVMFHETFTMSRGWRAWVMRQYQRRQFHQLASLADVDFFSTELWAQQRLARQPRKKSVHLPVGSNLPESTLDPAATRQRWRIEPEDFVCGVFGGAHPSRMLPWIELAVEQLASRRPAGRRVIFMHVGGEPIQWTNRGAPIIATGRLDATQAADAIAMMDILINPFSDGISTRRGSAMAALQHGVPVLSTRGHATDTLWEQVDRQAVFLASPKCMQSWGTAVDDALNALTNNHAQVRTTAKRFYQEHFAWPVVAETLLAHLASVKCGRTGA